MKSLLNKALNFAVLPIKLYITEVVVDFNRFARAAVWQEYLYGKEKDDNYQKSTFKTKKKNLPKNHWTPAGLKTFLSLMKSEIMEPKNWNEAKCNLPKEEVLALEELIKLQREREIIIMPCDNGAGILILNF